MAWYAPDATPIRGPLIAAVALGALAVASLPVVFALPQLVLGYLLALAGPLAVAAVGVSLRVGWLRDVGLAVTVAGALAAMVQLGQVLVVLLVASPLAVIVVVGDALRRVDPSLPTPLLAASAIAIAAGFAGAALSPPIVLAVTVLVLAGGVATTALRVAER